ncbi:MAG: protein-L-isoaspartate O-methyltransferase [Hadesarchaea archaeon]|nr:protein-L-isoaspartate O-methyltransferase [Hadesarchaea archaeon]
MDFERERERMVEELVRWGYLRTPRVIEAFRRVPREEFVPPSLRRYAYEDHPLSIGLGQTISAPSMIALMLESLEVERGQKVLEVGTGSGYNAALLAELVTREGRVVSIERLPRLASFGRENLRRTGYDWVEVVVGDGTCGYEPGAPWDRILITACSPGFPPPLLDQLRVGGRIGAPIGHFYHTQVWKVAEKGEEGLRVQSFTPCSFVPLVGKYGWKEG